MSVQFKKGDKVVVDWETLFNSESNYPAERRAGLVYEDDTLVLDEEAYEELSFGDYLVVHKVDDRDNTVQFKQAKGMTEGWWLPAFCLKKVEK